MKKIGSIGAALCASLLVLGGLFTACPQPETEPTEERTLKSIEVTATDAKKEFVVGEEFNSDSLVVKAKYNIGAAETLEASAYTVEVPAANKDEAGKLKLSGTDDPETVTVTVTYQEKTDTYDITISSVALSKIEINLDGAKDEYEKGADFDPAGIVVKAFYGDSDTTGTDITSNATITLKKGDTAVTTLEETGEYTVVAEYAGVSDSESITITVTEPYVDPNLITEAEVSGWNTDANAEPNFTGSLEDGFSVDFIASTFQWGAQFKIATDAAVAKDDIFKFSVTANTSVAMNGITLKFDNDKQIYMANMTLSTPAEEDKEFVVYGKASQAVDNIMFVFDFGNNAAATVKLSDLSFEIIEPDYDVTDISLTASATSISAGDTVTFTVLDQYGISVDDAVLSIVTEDAVSTIAGNVLTAGNKGETVTVKAKVGALEKTIDIVISAEKNYGAYFTAENAGNHTEGAAKDTPGYMYLWAEGYALSDVSASETTYTFTRTGSGAWYGTQLFYAENAGAYNVSFKVKSSTAGDIQINNEVKTLEADTDQEISFTKTLTGTDTLISIQLGKYTGEVALPVGTFTLSDFSVTKAE